MARRSFAILAGLAAVGGSLAVLGPAATAAAAPAPHAAKIIHARQPGGLQIHSRGASPKVLRDGTTVSVSDNWSGYAAVGTYTSVSASWTQPASNCAANTKRNNDEYASFWVGLDGWANNSVEQTGTDSDCNSKTPSYYGWYEMYPAYPVNFSNTVKPGDKMTASVNYTGTSSTGGRKSSTVNDYTLVLQDVTQKWTQTVKQTISPSVQGTPNSSAEIVSEAPCCQSNGDMLPLADFSPITYTSATANGLPIGSAANLQEFYIQDLSGVNQDTTSALTGGESFTNTWLASS